MIVQKNFLKGSHIFLAIVPVVNNVPIASFGGKRLSFHVPTSNPIRFVHDKDPFKPQDKVTIGRIPSKLPQALNFVFLPIRIEVSKASFFSKLASIKASAFSNRASNEMIFLLDIYRCLFLRQKLLKINLHDRCR